MKKLLVIAAALAALSLLVGCGGNGAGGDDPFTNVSTGKSYSLDITGSDTYPDSGNAELTDGADDVYDFAAAVAVFPPDAESEASITIDLGEVVDNLSFFGVKAISCVDWGIILPTGIAVSVSDDNVNFSSVVENSTRQYSANPVAHGDDPDLIYCTFGYTAPEYVSGRYVKIEILLPASVDASLETFDWSMVSEALVYSGEPADGYEAE